MKRTKIESTKEGCLQLEHPLFDVENIIMGVPGFLSFMRRTHRDCFSRVQRNKLYFDFVGIDVNTILYNAVKTGRRNDEVDVIRRIRSSLFHHFSLARPRVRGKFMLAADGPGPVAKLEQQRTRRMGEETKSVIRARLKEGSSEPKAHSGMSSFDSLNFTPGTAFMAKVGEEMHRFASDKVLNSEKLFRTHVSCPASPGEGELKIFSELYSDFVRPFQRNKGGSMKEDRLVDSARFVDRRRSACVVGADSDIIIMGLCSGIDRLTVIVTAPMHRAPAAFCLNTFQNKIMEKGNFSKEDMPKVRTDLAAIVCLQGNDYIPKVNFIPHTGDMWDAYIELRNGEFKSETLIKKSEENSDRLTINTRFLGALLKKARKPNMERDRRKGKDTKLSTATKEDKLDQARAWSEGLLWTLESYSSGQVPAFDWTYSSDHFGKSNVEIENLLLWCEVSNAEAICPFSDDASPLEPHKFALAVLPKQGVAFIPTPLQALTREPSPLAKYYERCRVCDDLKFKLNPLRRRLETVVKMLKLENDEEKIASLKEQRAELKMSINEVESTFKLHEEEKHPVKYTDLVPPIELIHSIVDEIPKDSYTFAEQRQMTFQDEIVYSRNGRNGTLNTRTVNPLSRPRFDMYGQ